MANERRLNKSAARTPRHGSSTTTTTTAAAAASAGRSNSSSSSSSSSTVNAVGGGKKQSRQYRFPHPPVPHAQTSLLQSQRVPASAVAYPSARQVGYESPQLSDSRYYASGGRRGGLATTTTTTTTTTAAAAASGLAVSAVTSAAAAAAADATDGSTEAAVPSADPDVMEAKKGLNKWGAFDSLSGSGTGTFGFGPLLFHHVDETPRDPYDTTNMMLNDPISFNPMSAISWARLDDSPDSVDELEGDLSSAAQQPDMALAAAAGASGGRKDGSSGRAGYVDSPASTAASPRHGSGASYASDVSESRTSSVAGSSVGNISRTFSDTSLVSPDTERSTAGAPPAYTSPSSSRTPSSLPGQQQQPQQQQQQQQQLGRQTEASVQYGTHQAQQLAYTAQQPPSNRGQASSHRASASQQPYSRQSYAQTRPQQHAQHSSRHRHPQQPSTQSRPQQQQQQQMPAPATSLPAGQTPATTDLLLCLGPHCSARFPTEQELAAHYRAEHAFTCTWTSCSAASFTSRNALTWHVNAEHLLMCPVPGCCGATFGSKRALDGHLKVSRLGLGDEE